MTRLDRHRRSGDRSRGVWSPSALAALEARLTPACLTGHLPSSGFCTLLTAYFFQGLPALFHAGNALGVFPSGLFPLTELTASSRMPLPSCRWLSTREPLVRSKLQPRPPGESVGYKALLPVRIRHRPGGMSAPEDRCPPGFVPSREFLSDAVQNLRSGSPRELRPSPRPKARVRTALQGLDHARAGLTLPSLPPLLGFLHLVPWPSA